jgi:hypothetical protein
MKKVHYALLVVLCGMFAFIGAHYYTSSAEYKSKKQYQNALTSIENADFDEAITSLQSVISSNTSLSSTAIVKLFELSKTDQMSAQQTVVAFQITAPHSQNVPNFFESASEKFTEFQGSEPIQSALLAVLLAEHQETEEAYISWRRKAHALFLENKKQLNSFAEAETFTLLDEELNGCMLCPELLEPYMNELGNRESARALGQYYARSNEAEKSFALLQPYLETRLSAYQSAEAHYNALTDKAWDEAIDFLDSGNGPDSFYDQYNQADEPTRYQLINDFYSSRIQDDQQIIEAWSAYQLAATVVPVALDLGIVRLTRATTMTNPDIRAQELSEAESLFLAVKSYAGDSDEYQLYLGQVYYWLGKQDKGDELFDELLNKYDRNDGILGSISRVLRDLGAEGKSKQYAEEAYEKANVEDKKGHAYQLYLLSTALDDQMTWLERSDKSKPWVQADLYATKAAQEEKNGNTKEAAEQYQKAIDIYLAANEEQYSYNNIALIYMRKYRLVGNESDFDSALTNMDLAIKSSPDDRITLSNAADYYGTKTYRTFLKDRLDLRALNYTPSLDLVRYFYKNESEKKVVISEIGNLDSFPKMMEYTKKSTLLAPKNRDMFGKAYSAIAFYRAEEDTKAFAQRLDDIEFESLEQQKDMEEYRSGSVDTQRLSDIEESLGEFKELHANLSPEKNPIEYIVFSSDLTYLKLSRYHYGMFYDVSEDLKLAENNFQIHPSSATLSSYKNALVHDIIYQLRAQSIEFKELHEQYFRYLSNEYLIGIATETIDSASEDIAKIKSARILAELMLRSEKDFPYAPSAIDWYLASAIGSPAAHNIQRSYSNDPLSVIREKIVHRTYVNEEEVSMFKYICFKVRGDEEQANEVILESISNNLAIPDGLTL